MSQSLLAALDEARALIEQGADLPSAVPCTCGGSLCDRKPRSLTARILEWINTSPALAIALYEQAGIPSPIASSSRTRQSQHPHDESVAFRVRAAMGDGAPWTVDALKRVSGGKTNAVRLAIFRMQRDGCPLKSFRSEHGMYYQQEAAI